MLAAGSLAAAPDVPSSQPVSVEVPPPIPLAIGAAAPAFDLPGVDGRRYQLADFADARILVVIFTCNHCPTAQAYEGRIKKLVEDYKSRSVQVVAISPNDPEAVRLNELGYTDLGDSLNDMRIRARAAAFNFPYLYDGETQTASRAYGPKVTPHVFIFDAARKLRYCGRIDDAENPAKVRHDDTRNALDALLADRPVPVETTKTFGCSVKWSDKRESVTTFMEQLAREPVELETVNAETLRTIRANPGEKLRLINVWATWCGPCVAELPRLVETNHMYRHRHFEFVTVSMDPPSRAKEAVRLLKAHRAANRNVILDEDRPYEVIEIIDPEWSGALPYTLLIEPGGKVLYRKEGAIDPLELRRAIVNKLGRSIR
ncbi:MAG: redoxin domain-containing protein [Phycisphaerae bacterium]|nr:redoxin domain-containing protein [Phycisphaerae bacterium]